MRHLNILILAALFGLFAALPNARAHDENHGHALTIDQPWARTTGTRTMSAAVYLILHNDSHAPDTLVGAETDRAEIAEVHRSFEEGGVMRMEHVPDLPLGPGEDLAFAPGGYHIMLMRLSAPLKEGEVFPLTLMFEKAGPVTVYVQVTGMAGLKP